MRFSLALPALALVALSCGDPPADIADVSPDTLVSDTVTAADRTLGDSLRLELARIQAAMDSAGLVTDTARAAPNAQDIVQGAAENARFLGIRVFWAVVVLLVAYLAIRVATTVLDALAERFATRRLLVKRLVPILRLTIWTFAVYYVIAGVFEVDRTSLIAATAAVGVAVGFAAQDVLKNIFGGLIIILDRPFQVGDKVRVDQTYGEVVSIGLRATRIVTPDDNLVSVPNLKVVEGQVANANAGDLDCQVVIDLYLPGWVDAAEARRIAYDAAASSRYAYLEKPIVVNVRDEFRETFLTHLLVKVYVLDTRFEFALASDVTETAKAEFRRRGMLPEMWAGRWAAPAGTGGAA